MKIFKTIIITIVLIVVLHIATLSVFSDAKIFSCQSKPIVPNMEKLKWQDGMCDVNYKYWTGSAQKLTPGANVARIGLIYVLPLVITTSIMYGLHKRKR